jgi:PncC family amidohydrolase
VRDGSTGKDHLEGEEIDFANADRIMVKLIDNGITIALAESISAGAIAHKLTSVVGSSKSFLGGIVCYSRFAKEKFLGVPSALLDEQGTVSRDVAIALAEGAQKAFDADFAFGITGNAGPTTDSDQSKVGEMHAAIISKDGDRIVKEFDLFGDRETIRAKSVTEALRMIREYVLEKYW